MANASTVNELVLRWQELRDLGQAISAEELCAGCPELLDELKGQLQALGSMEQFLGATGGNRPSSPPAGTPESAVLAETPPTIPIGPGAAAPEGGAARAGSRYRPLRLHARGGLGEVFVARDEEVSREVALKRMCPVQAGDADSRRRFLREGEITGSLEHPGVVPVYGLTRDADREPSYAMRFVRGQTLQEAIKQFHAAAAADWGLALRQLLGRFVAVCNTMGYAHSRGVIHRDLKPANIMLGDYGETLVLDWGLAKQVDVSGEAQPRDEEGPQRLPTAVPEGKTAAGTVLGTPAFMSPEQAAGRPDLVGPASDIYSLGATLYALLTGRPPLTGDSVGEVLQKVQQGAFAPPRQLRPDTPRALEAICLKAMVLEPAARYPTALALAADLERWLADEPVTCCREPLSARVGRWGRRHQALVSAAAAAGLALLAGLVVSIALAVRARQAEGQAQVKEQQAVAAQEIAEERFELAKASVDQYLNAVTKDPELKDKQDLNRLRKKLLETAVPFYQKLAEQKPGDAAQEAARGRAYHRLALVRVAMGELEAARADWEQMRAIFARLATDFPTIPDYRQDLAASHNNLGNLLADLGEQPAARAVYEQALKIWEKLAIDFPNVPAYGQELAKSHNNLGFLLASLGERPAARTAYEQALKIQEKLAADFPAVRAYRQDLAGSYGNLGHLLSDLGERPAARAAYEQALKIQEKLVADFPTFPSYRQQLANSHNSLGALLGDLGERPAARAAYEQALKIQEKLAADFPTVPEYRQGLAQSHNNLGNLVKDLGERPAARAAYEQALKILEKLAADFPIVPKYRQYLASSRNSLGALLGDLGERPTVRAAYEQALKIQEKLAADFPTVPEYRQGLAQSHNNLGNLLKDLGERPAARAAYEQALKILEKLVADFPIVPVYRINFAGSCCNYGNLLQDEGKPAAALEWYAKGQMALEGVLRQVGRDAKARLFLRNVHYGRARAFDQLGRPAEAARDWDRALDLDDGFHAVDLRLGKAASLARAGDHAQAVAEAEALTGGKHVAGATLYNAACVYALAAEAKADSKLTEVYAARAVALLRQAQAGGFFKNPANVDNVKKDPDLKPLHGRADYQQFLAMLPAAGKNPAPAERKP